jgi:hypothetical protein
VHRNELPCHKKANLDALQLLPAGKQNGLRLWMTRMSQKAGLTPDQEDLLNRYLNACRSERKPAK